MKDKLAAAGEMGVVLARTSMSPIVYEVLDFACVLTDERAQVVAQTNGLTLFTGTFGPQVESILRRYGEELEPGDIYMTNNPYEGGTHICDVKRPRNSRQSPPIAPICRGFGHSTDNEIGDDWAAVGRVARNSARHLQRNRPRRSGGNYGSRGAAAQHRQRGVTAGLPRDH